VEWIEMDGVEEDLRELGVENWKDQDRDRWRDIVMAVKTIRG